MASAPRTVEELFRFYHDYVKLLYSSVQVENQMPAEVLFELNAAFDHLSRRWTLNESEEQAVQKAYSHLKRSCLDIFKLRVKDARDKYDDLQRIDTSLIDNGEFDRGMRALMAEIKVGATQARMHEGRTQDDPDASIQAFDRWQPVYEKCIEFENTYYTHKSLDWAKVKNRRLGFKSFILGVLTSALATAFLENPLAEGIKWLQNPKLWDWVVKRFTGS